MTARVIDERHGWAGALGAAGGVVDERHGWAGALGAAGGVGGHVGAPHQLDR